MYATFLIERIEKKKQKITRVVKDLFLKIFLIVLCMYRNWGMDTGNLIDLRDEVEMAGLVTQERGAAAVSTATNAAEGAATAQPANMDLDNVSCPNLGNMYNQCKLATEAANTASYTCFGTGTTFTTGSAKITRIGNLNMIGDTEVESTFHGARICKGSKVVYVF
jgi:hypothetical protein